MPEQARPFEQTADPSPAANGGSGERALKALAKSLAQQAAAEIPDRHVRARVRTRCYAQFVTVFRQFDSRQAAERARHRRRLTAAGCAIIVLGLALTGSLLI